MNGEVYMSKLYVVKVYEGDEQYEYEFGNLAHATEFISMEKQPCSLWIADTITGNENRMPIPE